MGGLPASGACNTSHTGPFVKIWPGLMRLEAVFKCKRQGGGLRGRVCGFTSASRRRMLDLFGMLSEYPEVWQDFTFPDEVMEGLTTKERKEVARSTWARFRKRVLRANRRAWGIQRKEWQIRKSGRLVGERIPHYHLVYTLPGDSRHWWESCWRLAEMWVDCLPTDDEGVRGKAMAVSVHSKSFRKISSRAHCRSYLTKYVAKIDKWDDPDQGKHWGTFGVLPLASCRIMELTPEEAKRLRRVARGILTKKKWQRALSRRNNKLLKIYVNGEVVESYLSWLRNGDPPF